MTDYKPGDRVRVSFEGAVEHVFANGSLDVSGPDDFYTAVWPSSPYTVEKITPDYKAQIEALEPGTAFVLTTDGPDPDAAYLRNSAGVVTKHGVISTVDYILKTHGAVSDLRILK